jgi:phosphatidate phosphatase APP1
MRHQLIKAANKTENAVDKVVRRVKRRLYRHSKVTIVPYMGHGTQTHVELRGRVLENHRILPSNDDDSAWRNLRNIIRRFNSDELPFVEISASFQGQRKMVSTDEEGFFFFSFETEPLEGIWHDIQLHYIDKRRETNEIGQIMIPPSSAQFGIISDMDDTVLRSNVPNRLKLIANTLFKNAHTRLPFSGVAEFYRALQAGTAATFNPIYYVSNSPYNLYDLLTEFFVVRGIPSGPIYLRDFGLTNRLVGASSNHKAERIAQLFNLYPNLPFILIGDSGEHDPELYREVVRRFPNRVLAIYIRDVRSKAHDRVMQVAEEIRALGSEMLLVPDTLVAAQDAEAKGFILPESLGAIEAAVKADTPANPIEAMIDEIDGAL